MEKLPFYWSAHNLIHFRRLNDTFETREAICKKKSMQKHTYKNRIVVCVGDGGNSWKIPLLLNIRAFYTKLGFNMKDSTVAVASARNLIISTSVHTLVRKNMEIFGSQIEPSQLIKSPSHNKNKIIKILQHIAYSVVQNYRMLIRVVKFRQFRNRFLGFKSAVKGNCRCTTMAVKNANFTASRYVY